MQPNSPMNQLIEKKPLELPRMIGAPLAGTHWKCWLSPGAPWVEPDESSRNPYAPWLGPNHPVTSHKGLYIWLHPRPKQADKYRFIHIGISAKGHSTLSARNLAHCRNQLSGLDRVYQISYEPFPGGFGTLGMDFRGTPEAVNKAKIFLKALRVLFIAPPANHRWEDDKLAGNIRRLEGLIARSAAHLLSHDSHQEGQWEITNTVGRTARYGDMPGQHSEDIARALNSVVDMLPTTPRNL